MICENAFRVSNNQAISQATGTSVVSTNSIDLEQVEREIGEGMKMRFYITPTVTGTGASATLAFQVILADAANLTGNIAVVGATDAYAATSLIAAQGPPNPNADGTPLVIEINPQMFDTFFLTGSRRFLGLRYVAGGTGTATVTLIAELVMGHQGNQKNYPTRFTVIG